ncbi:MAG: hypothetical protein ACXAC7_15190 [Candidatus Hodarchaeales archaeon]|jgi:hypothetical protein
MNIQLVLEEEKNDILEEITILIGNNIIPQLTKLVWLQFPSGIWCITKQYYQQLISIILNLEESVLQFTGFYLGKRRKIFAISLESLNFLKNMIKRYVIIQEKPLKKFLYGKTVRIPLLKLLLCHLPECLLE